MLFLHAIPVVLRPTRILFAAGTAIAVFVPVLSHLLRPALPAASGGNITPGQVFTDPVGLLLELALTGLYPAPPWMACICICICICIGIALGRLRLSEHRVAVRLLAVGAAVATGAGALSALLLGPLGGESRLCAAAAESGLSSTDVSDLLVFGNDGVTPTTTWWWLVWPRSSGHQSAEAVRQALGLLGPCTGRGPRQVHGLRPRAVEELLTAMAEHVDRARKVLGAAG